MKIIIVLTLTIASFATAQHQQQLDPSYLQQYYSQQLSEQQEQSGSRPAEATPIYESGSQETEQQYVPQGQQIRVKDNVSEQV